MDIDRWQCSNATAYQQDEQGFLSGIVKGVYMGRDYTGGPGGMSRLKHVDQQNLHYIDIYKNRTVDHWAHVANFAGSLTVIASDNVHLVTGPLKDLPGPLPV